MIWSTPALKDATLYELDPYRNTGLDQILEIIAAKDPDTGSNIEARPVLQFDLTQIPQILSDNGVSIADISATLNLHTVQESEIPDQYIIEAKMIGDTWTNGTGYTTYPAGTIIYSYPTDGINWNNTSGTGSLTWVSASMVSTSSMSYNTNAGGGDWVPTFNATQSFSYRNNDSISINVSSIVKAWLTGSNTNNGFLVKLSNPFSSSLALNTVIQLYSTETHTVYQPQLFISWTGSLSYITGSLSVATINDNPQVYVNSLRNEYTQNSKVRIQLGTRPKFPRPSFSQNTAFANSLALPSSSYYQIKDAHSNEVIIPYSNATMINTTSSGSYFDFYTTMLYPERFYRFEIKACFSNPTTSQIYSSNEFIFKIVQ